MNIGLKIVTIYIIECITFHNISDVDWRSWLDQSHRHNMCHWQSAWRISIQWETTSRNLRLSSCPRKGIVCIKSIISYIHEIYKFISIILSSNNFFIAGHGSIILQNGQWNVFPTSRRYCKGSQASTSQGEKYEILSAQGMQITN